MRYNILGMPTDATSYHSVVAQVERSVRNRNPLWILAMNPEKIIKAIDSQALKTLLLNADIFIPDGFGILLAGRIMGTSFPERVTGADLVALLAKTAAKNGWNVFLLGAAPGVADEVAARWRANHPNISIVGVQDGYFPAEEEEKVIAEINQTKADLLFVAMGSPRQEQFIQKYRHSVIAPVCMGVGGSFDVISGKAKRAPVWMQRIGMEWTYRLIKDPKRILRISALPRFIMLVILSKVGLFKPAA